MRRCVANREWASQSRISAHAVVKETKAPARVAPPQEDELQELSRLWREQKARKEASQRQMTKKRKRTSYEDIRCQKCKTGEHEDQLLLCDGCEGGYHTYCLRPILVTVPMGPFYCPACSNSQGIQEFPLIQTKLYDFFRITKSASIRDQGASKKKRRPSILVHKRKRVLHPHRPTSNPQRRLEQMASLATGLTALGIEFCDELAYQPGMAAESANQAQLEAGGMQVMGKEDRAAYEKHKELCRQGEGPPLLVRRDPHEGFVVEADGHIRDWSIVVEYTGDVDFAASRASDDCDSIMGLIHTKDGQGDLVICPDKRANAARFISGINNHTPGSRRKINVRCVRFDVDGQAKALIVAIRDICKGERLYYDYNGLRYGYPTEHFL